MENFFKSLLSVVITIVIVNHIPVAKDFPKEVIGARKISYNRRPTIKYTVIMDTGTVMTFFDQGHDGTIDQIDVSSSGNWQVAYGKLARNPAFSHEQASSLFNEVLALNPALDN